MEALDKLDRLILRSLQADGRATYDQIAEQTGLRKGCMRRPEHERSRTPSAEP